MKGERGDLGITLDTRAKLFRGLADPGRLSILICLQAGPRSSGELANECGLSPSNASNHLRCLLGCGLVVLEPRGRRNLYRLSDPRVALLLDASTTLLGSPAGALIRACCRYESLPRRALSSFSRAAVRHGPASDSRECGESLE